VRKVIREKRLTTYCGQDKIGIDAAAAEFAEGKGISHNRFAMQEYQGFAEKCT
jgi:hypothetical protein